MLLPMLWDCWLQVFPWFSKPDTPFIVIVTWHRQLQQTMCRQRAFVAASHKWCMWSCTPNMDRYWVDRQDNCVSIERYACSHYKCTGGPPAWHPAHHRVQHLCSEARELCASRGVDIARLAIRSSVEDVRAATTMTSFAKMTLLEVRFVGVAVAMYRFDSVTVVQVLGCTDTQCSGSALKIVRCYVRYIDQGKPTSLANANVIWMLWHKMPSPNWFPECITWTNYMMVFHLNMKANSNCQLNLQTACRRTSRMPLRNLQTGVHSGLTKQSTITYVNLYCIYM